MMLRAHTTRYQTMDTNKSIHIYLDDIRNPPSGDWTVVRSSEEAYSLISNACSRGQKMIVSLDHDLGENNSTGYDLLNWLERDIAKDEDFRPKIMFYIHSANPVGCDNMRRAIQSIERLLQ